MSEPEEAAVQTQQEAIQAPRAPSTQITGSGLRPWQPGKSGNPGGRPRVPAEVKELARTYTTNAIEALVSVLHTGSDNAKVAAANSLLDRAWGKPEQSVTVNDTAKMSLVDLLTSLSRPQLALDVTPAAPVDGVLIEADDASRADEPDSTPADDIP